MKFNRFSQKTGHKLQKLGFRKQKITNSFGWLTFIFGSNNVGWRHIRNSDVVLVGRESDYWMIECYEGSDKQIDLIDHLSVGIGDDGKKRTVNEGGLDSILDWLSDNLTED
jgi:hypothetical protein